ncbi:MAG: sulfite exporter TauE/SafE family protein [Nitrososphaerales archaeon]
MEPLTILLVFLFAIIAGLFGSLLGLGGGIFMIPFLSLLLNFEIHQAIAASILGVVAISVMGSTLYLKKGLTDINLGTNLEAITALGALIGASLAVSMSRDLLSVIFGSLLLYTFYHMLKGRVEESKENSDNEPKNMKKGLIISFLAGNIAGMLGVGGGLIQVPLMYKIMKISIKRAIATSNYIMGVTGASAALIFLSKEFVNPLVAIPTITGIALGAQMGPRLALRWKPRTIRLIFTIVILYFGVRMSLRGFGFELTF